MHSERLKFHRGVDILSKVGLNLIALRKARPPGSFGHSEFNTVKGGVLMIILKGFFTPFKHIALC